MEFRWLGIYTYIRYQYIVHGWEDGDSKVWDNLYWVPKSFDLSNKTEDELMKLRSMTWDVGSNTH